MGRRSWFGELEDLLGRRAAIMVSSRTCFDELEEAALRSWKKLKKLLARADRVAAILA
jgi:hypothetical protein